MRQAIILAGGRGTRLGERTSCLPKPMLPAGDRPFLETVVRHLAFFNLRKILLVTGYLSDAIERHFGDGSKWGVRIDYARERELAGTGGFLRLFTEMLDDRFLLLNGDTLFDINILDLAACQSNRGTLCAMALRRVEDTARYGAVQVEGERVTGFSEKARGSAGVINGGIYVLDRRAAEYATSVPCSLEKDLLPRMVADGRVCGRVYDGFFIDIGIPSTLESAQRSVPAWWRKPIAFLDRDGVINKDRGYTHAPEQFEWIDGAPEAIRLLNEAGYRVVAVTNQAGIARGYYDEDTFHRFMDWIHDALQPYGARIDAVYYCPHHPTEGQGKYRTACDCRKPAPGLLQQALADFEPDPNGCFLIGDKASDLQAAESAGIKGHLFLAHENLADFVRTILGENR